MAPATTAPSTRPTVDLLVISGGGDWGAFGAGVLKGWGRVRGDGARPQFDVVTGVSTGALIAPFAFLGDDASIERVVQLYRNPKKDWAKSRGMLFFWPTNPSFYELPGLERELKKEVNDETLRRIAAEDGTGRCLIVNTSNVDFGDMHAWDIVSESKKALAANDPGRVRSILLASAGIPGIFPSRGIDQWMYVDGAITGNILYAGSVREEQTIAAQWQAKYPKDPLPRVRYWVIFNNQLRFPPQVTERKWPAIISRATIMATQDATVNSIQHLYALAEISRMKRNVDVEVRLMCIPDDWVPPNQKVFDKEVMNNLADLGERMGAHPSAWRTEPP
jgi:predicted acylesterase/phospholipase RssA